jgi:hypothetical protein
MAQYIVTQTEFVEIAEKSGTLQNDSNVVIEISNSRTPNSGIRIYPHESKSFGTMPKYARALGNTGPGVLRVVDFMETIPDGEDEVSPDDVATDEEIDDLIDDVYGDTTQQAGAGEDTVSGDGADLDGL